MEKIDIDFLLSFENLSKTKDEKTTETRSVRSHNQKCLDVVEEKLRG